MTQAANMPRRDASRDGSGGCLVCGAALDSRRLAIARAPISNLPFACVTAPEYPTCRSCEQNFSGAAQRWHERCTSALTAVGERRCPECPLFSRAMGLGGHCPECDAPVLLAELLGEEVVALR